MTTKKMTRQQEHDFYADPENQTPQGPPRRRRSKLTELVPVRFPPETLERVRRRADADDRSLSSWIRRAVEHELDFPPVGRTSDKRAGTDASRERHGIV